MGGYRAIVAATLIGLGGLVATGCASRGADGASPPPTRPARRSNILITQDELTKSSARDALQAVQMLLARYGRMVAEPEPQS